MIHTCILIEKITYSEDLFSALWPIGPFLSLIIKMEGTCTPYFDSYENIPRLSVLVFQSHNSELEEKKLTLRS